MNRETNQGVLREFNKTIDDPCAIQQRNNDNTKKFKFITTNHIDLINAKTDYNFFGMTMRDHLFVPGEKMDDYSSLIQGTSGNINTNCNIKSGFGALPLNIPSKYQSSHGDTDIETGLRNLTESNRNSLNPRESSFHERSFYLFNEKFGTEVPNPLRSVENWPRSGMSGRFYKQI